MSAGEVGEVKLKGTIKSKNLSSLLYSLEFDNSSRPSGF
jgi:hypothetical protein